MIPCVNDAAVRFQQCQTWFSGDVLAGTTPYCDYQCGGLYRVGDMMRCRRNCTTHPYNRNPWMQPREFAFYETQGGSAYGGSGCLRQYVRDVNRCLFAAQQTVLPDVVSGYPVLPPPPMAPPIAPPIAPTRRWW